MTSSQAESSRPGRNGRIVTPSGVGTVWERVGVGSDQRPAHPQQLADDGESRRLGQPGGGRVWAVRPDLDRASGRLGDEPLDQESAETESPVLGMDDDVGVQRASVQLVGVQLVGVQLVGVQLVGFTVGVQRTGRTVAVRRPGGTIESRVPRDRRTGLGRVSGEQVQRGAVGVA